MMPLALSAALVVVASPASAAASAAPTAAPPARSPVSLAYDDPRQKALDEVAAWRAFLPRTVPPRPLTVEFGPRLDRIEAAFKAADPAGMTRPQKDFEAWQHEVVLATCREAAEGCASLRQLNAFSSARRANVEAYRLLRRRIVVSRLNAARLAAGDASALFDGAAAGGDASAASAGDGSADFSGTSAAPRFRASAGAPPPPPSAKPFALSSLVDWIDYEGIEDAAIRAVESIKNRVAGYGRLLSGFAGSCYYGAKWLMIKAGMLPPEVKAPEQIGSIGIGSGHAYMFNAALKRDPKLQERLHVRLLDLASLKDSEVKLVPEKTLFVFDRGCAGFSSTSGHIEMKLDDDKLDELPSSAFYSVRRTGPKYKPAVAPNEVLACSDGCLLHTAAYLRTYARRGCLNAYAPVLDRPAPPPAPPVPSL